MGASGKEIPRNSFRKGCANTQPIQIRALDKTPIASAAGALSLHKGTPHRARRYPDFGAMSRDAAHWDDAKS